MVMPDGAILLLSRVIGCVRTEASQSSLGRIGTLSFSPNYQYRCLLIRSDSLALSCVLCLFDSFASKHSCVYDRGRRRRIRDNPNAILSKRHFVSVLILILTARLPF